MIAVTNEMVEAGCAATDVLIHPDEMRAAIVAALAASKEGWRDIQSAPNGVKILVFGGRYNEVDITVADGGWWRVSLERDIAHKGIPTHWMPLPASPSISAPAGKTQE